MNVKASVSLLSCRPFGHADIALFAGALLLWLTGPAGAANILWTNTTSGGSWLNATYWAGGNVPAATDDAQFGANPTQALIIGISLSSSSLNNGANNEAVGAIEVTLSRNYKTTVGNSSATAGTLTVNGTTVNGVANVILRNANGNGKDLVIQDNGGGSGLMTLALANATENIVALDSSGGITLGDVIASSSGTTPLTFTGSGSGAMAVTNAGNTFAGTIKVTGAEVDFGSDGSLGNSANNIVINGGRLGITSGTSVTIAAARSISLGANAVGVNTGTAISAPGAAGVLSYNGALADLAGFTGTLVKQGAGKLVLGGVSTFSGNVSINNGTVQLAAGNDRLPTGATVYLGTATSANLGTLDLNGWNQTLTGLNSTAGNNTTAAGKNLVTNTSATVATLTLSGSGNYFFGNGTTNNSGVIAGPINLVVGGSGTNTLGDTNTYTGNTTITNTGTLALGGAGSIAGTPQVAIAAGATLDVSAAGFTFSGTSPAQKLTGSSSSGIANLNATGRTVTLASGATIAVHALGGAGSSVGKISVAGALTLNTNIVTVNLDSGTLQPGTYRLLDCTGTLTGTANSTPAFAGPGFVPPGAAVAINTTPGAAGHVDLVVNQSGTLVSLASSENPSGFKDTVVFTATLPADATGSVVFASTNGPLSTNNIVAGQAVSASLNTLPRGTNVITATYTGDGNYPGGTGTLNQIVTNHPPVATNLCCVRCAAVNSLHLAVSNLLAGVTDADGDAVYLLGTGVSTNGVVVANDAGNLSYLNNNAMADKFNYTVADSFGGTSTATVSIVISTNNLGGQVQTFHLTGDNHTAVLNFAGIPAYGYAVQRSTNLTDWADVLLTNAPADGLFQWTDDLGVLPAQLYYRLRYNP